jgi:hypothetical protein
VEKNVADLFIIGASMPRMFNLCSRVKIAGGFFMNDLAIKNFNVEGYVMNFMKASMKRKGWLALSMGLAFLASCGNKEQKPVVEASVPIARLTIAKGEVNIVEGESVKAAVAGQILTAGQMIRTGSDAMAEVFLKDQGIVRLSENTEFALKRVDASGVELDQSSGKATVFLKRLKQDTEFTITTPTSVAAVRGTSFLVDVKSKTESNIALFDGAVEVKSKRGQSVVMDQKGELSVTDKSNISKEAIRPLSKESLDHLKKMAVFQKTQIEEYNSFIDDLKETTAIKMTREEGDVKEQVAAIKDRPSSQDNTGKASTTDENLIRRNTEKDPLKIQPQKSFK